MNRLHIYKDKSSLAAWIWQISFFSLQMNSDLVSEGANGMYYVTDLCLVGCAHLAGRMINKNNFCCVLGGNRMGA